MKTLLLAIALSSLVGACKKKEEKAQAAPAVSMSVEEVKRSEDACKMYVERVCACASTVPDVSKQCELARALPDAVRMALQEVASSESKPDVVQQSATFVRKTAKECIEQTAKLPALGCQ